MSRIRITGIVRTANCIRNALTGPLSTDQRDSLREQVRQALAQIDDLLQTHGIRAEKLPPPSRRAYHFLKELDLDQLPALDPANSPPARPHDRRRESVSFPGLRVYLTQILDDIALNLDTGRFNPDASLKVIAATTERINQTIQRERLEPDHLKPEARQMVGWFRYFSRPAALEVYARAVRLAQRVLPSPLAARPQLRRPFILHYRPSSMLYRIQTTPRGTRFLLDTPMLTFTEESLRQLAQRILGRSRHQREMMDAMLSDEYQQLQAELEASGGIVERTRGLAHDLAESFDRVNREYFGGRMARPGLAWNKVLTGRKFGHYDFIHDRILISSTLDHPEVPPWVLDHVMHHELLHKKHGFRFQGSRQHAHTPAFREEEKSFRRYAEACEYLNHLSAGHR